MVTVVKDVEHYYRAFLEILAAHLRAGGPGLPEQRAPAQIAVAGHQAIRALVEEIYDQGYVLGQLHADGIFPEGEEADVAAREDRLKILELKAQGRYRMGRTDTPPQTGETVYGIRPHFPWTPEEDRARRELAERYIQENPVDVDKLKAPTDRSGEAVRGLGYNPSGGLGDGRN